MAEVQTPVLETPAATPPAGPQKKKKKKGMGRGAKIALTIIILAAVAISTLLNAAYFLGTAVELFIPTKEGDVVLPPTVKKNKYTAVSMVCLIVMNLLLGIFSQPILSVLAEGLTRFA